MGQGRSEGRATADRFVYLACLWYPALPPPPHTQRWLCLQPDLEVTTRRRIKATFHQESTITAPLTTQTNSKHMRQRCASFPLLWQEKPPTNVCSELKYCKGRFIKNGNDLKKTPDVILNYSQIHLSYFSCLSDSSAEFSSVGEHGA